MKIALAAAGILFCGFFAIGYVISKSIITKEPFIINI